MHFLSIALLSLSFSLFADDVADREAQWNDALREIKKSCVEESYEEVSCVYQKNNPVFQRTYVMLEKPLVTVGTEVIPRVSDLMGEALWGARVLLNPREGHYWLYRSIDRDYFSLKKSLVRKSKREKLRNCQKACLATCVSSRILKYEVKFFSQYNSALSKVERGGADCKGFSMVALDILHDLRVPSHMVLGSLYKRSSQGVRNPKPHAQVQVSIKGKKYIMEPQHKTCRFYNPVFHKKTAVYKFGQL